MNNYLENNDEKGYFKLFKKKYHLKGQVSAAPVGKDEHNQKKRIWLDGIELMPEMGHGLRQFYECAIGWGDTGGSAAFTTALTLCLSIFKEERLAENLFVCFKQDIVQCFPDHDFEMDIDLTEFIKKHRSRFHPHLYSRFCYSSLVNCREIMLYKDPQTDEITANLAENYAMHNINIPNETLRKLNERKQRLIFRIFSKGRHIIKGYDFDEIMVQVEEVMSAFYWKSLENVLKKQYLEKYKGL